MTLGNLIFPLTKNVAFEDLDDDVLETLLVNRNDERWRTKGAEGALKGRLGPAYHRLIEISVHLQALISRLLITMIYGKPVLQRKLEASIVRWEAPSLQERSLTVYGEGCQSY